MIESFGVTRKTLDNWENSKEKRKILYEVLKSLPIEYVEKIKKRVQEEEELKESLKDIKDK